ncbi:2-succinyl-6-hydroxy-2,4-cyclohexadiene-1-carboxylate synthase [Cyclonatronum proteinivorum]|uniref:2-succinyl-6-hydroxy-2, 4-cyclohexadiene-1-carboxylate synthase n=1 Tax=Cyclonatronum proteinivorum TaxID=1457365 RepID=A0A345UKC7_9BACT|nr:alpha/beta fold hydrolase [Cyclonatronum proteinivorum]AXJ00929.1 2-succinyl-6-hydroxy-2,4-cyclohexadiene-1-carboxylate synthase [Cyclonatronum proteinivorum]
MYTFEREGLTYKIAVSDSSTQGPSLLMLHGFAGSHQSFAHLLPHVKGFSRVMCPDLAGHGLSLSQATDPTARYAPKKQTEDLRLLLRELSTEKLVIYGYSMGARLALQLACALSAKPETGISPVGLLCESGSAGLRSESERRARRDSDRRLAQKIRTDFGAFHQSWDQLPVFETGTQPSTDLTKTLREIRSKQEPHHLAASLQAFGTGSMPALHDQLAQLSMPVTLLTGSCDTKFTHIANELLPLFGSRKKEHLCVPDCGHRIHLEQPHVVIQQLNALALPE